MQFVLTDGGNVLPSSFGFYIRRNQGWEERRFHRRAPNAQHIITTSTDAQHQSEFPCLPPPALHIVFHIFFFNCLNDSIEAEFVAWVATLPGSIFNNIWILITLGIFNYGAQIGHRFSLLDFRAGYSLAKCSRGDTSSTLLVVSSYSQAMTISGDEVVFDSSATKISGTESATFLKTRVFTTPNAEVSRLPKSLPKSEGAQSTRVISLCGNPFSLDRHQAVTTRLRRE